MTRRQLAVRQQVISAASAEKWIENMAATKGGALVVRSRPKDHGTGAPATGTPMQVARDLAKELSDSTDELTGKLAKAEKGLAGLNLGVWASADMTDENERALGKSVLLNIRKDGASWHLFIATREADSFGDWEFTKLLQSSKKMRMRAAAVVGDLLQAMIDKAREELAEVREASRHLDVILDDIKAVDPADPFGAPVDYASDDDIPF